MAGGDLIERLPVERPSGARRSRAARSTDEAAEPAKADHMHATATMWCMERGKHV